MSTRLKSFIGMLILVTLVIIYALVATTVAAYRLADSEWYVHLAFFGLSGLLWVVPAMFVISWMLKPSKKEAEEKRNAKN
ncbi:DUF2842 domain-containing protein [Ahrensia marina]|uniref:DUF2842 domain-containing protein n=1 Tax=Ahrensia marina TaxID=1514904 RepID=A0A0M9GNN1_9HYPH|nr:DUF2842 domain-containing protein [Ahrensia marina]KPB01769.1 hypothetical protein SU32_06770 [Ahrensia marina]